MKFAYPNYSDYIPTSPTYDINRWVDAMRNIYVKLHLGASKNEAIDQITKEWGKVEKREFLNWLKYYESGDQLKYKMAQNSYYVNDDINYFLPNPKNPIVPSPITSISDIPQQAQNIVQNKPAEMSVEDKRRIIEDQRRKILGRLNAAEKILSSHQGQIFAGNDFEKILIAIYELKKQIQTVNKISLSSQTVIDLIIRQANKLKIQGHTEASNFFVKFAQNTPGDFSFNLGQVPSGGSQPDGTGSLTNNNPDVLQPPPPSSLEMDDNDKESPVEKFVENLNSFGLTTEDDNKAKDDEVIINDDVLLDQEVIPEDYELVVKEAQQVPSPSKENIDIKPNSIQQESERILKTPSTTNFDSLIDSAFANITVNDVIVQLEAINNIFRNREISRQLAIIDVMLDRLGLAPYFPTLGEIINKQLEANSYCLSRAEDIFSKLRGTIETKEIDLIGNNPSERGSAARSILEQEEKKEKQRKEVRKQLQDKTDLEKSIKPEGTIENVQQDLINSPVSTEKPVKPII